MPLLLLSLVLAAAGPGPGPSRNAERLFREARDLLSSGRAAEACPLFEESHALDPALGTLLNLADCREKTGQLVQAYLRFNEAAAWAQRTREGKREEVARQRAAALKAKLSWVALSSAAPVNSLTVVIQGFRVNLGQTPESVPVDAGEVEIHAEAPGFVSWSTRVTVASTSVLPVVVPPLAQIAAPRPAPPPTIEVTAPAPGPAAPGGAIALISIGGAALVAGGVGLALTLTTYDRTVCQQPGNPCASAPTVTRSQFEQLQWQYPASWVAVGLGAAATVAGIVWYARGARGTLAVIPTTTGPLVVLGGEF